MQHHDVVFRSFRPNDAEPVNVLFREAYGESYPYKTKLILPPGTYCCVATSGDEVVGFARSRWLDAEAFPQVYELGGYVVTERMRRRGIGERLSALCEEAARADQGEIHILHSEPVSWGNELASQRIFEKHGFRVLGAAMLKYPDISADHHGDQPASMTLVARRVENNGRFTQRARHLPPDYECFAAGVMRGCPTSDSDGLLRFPMPEIVRHAPVEAAGRLGAEIIDVPANWPASLETIAALRKDGYLLSGFLPEHGQANGTRFDYLRLYRPPASHRRGCDWDLIGVLPGAEHVKQFVRREYVRRYG